MRFRESVMIDEDHFTCIYIYIYIYYSHRLDHWQTVNLVFSFMKFSTVCLSLWKPRWSVNVEEEAPYARDIGILEFLPTISQRNAFLSVHSLFTIIETKDHKSHHSIIGGKQTRICKTKASRVLNLPFPPCLFSSIVSIVDPPASCRPPPRPVNAVCRRNCKCCCPIAN